MQTYSLTMSTNKLTTSKPIKFSDIMQTIESDYTYTPSAFTNGIGEDVVVNPAGTNEGSCKIFAFAKLNQLSQSDTLELFGEYYRDDVLNNPEGTDHANIRTFMKHGWSGISFETDALIKK